MEIRAATITQAWPQILRRIIDMGVVKYIGHHAQWVIEYDEPIVTTLYNPTEDMIPPGSGWDERTLDMYAEQIMNPVNDGFTYTYGERLNTNSQIENLILKLAWSPSSRQAIATTWKPKNDQFEKYPPCMLLIDFKIYHGKLNTVVYFRSNDMYMAWPQNCYGIIKLIKYIARRIEIGIGRFTIISNAPHIYFTSLLDAMEVAGYYGKERMMKYQVFVDEIYGINVNIDGAIP